MSTFWIGLSPALCSICCNYQRVIVSDGEKFPTKKYITQDASWHNKTQQDSLKNDKIHEFLECISVWLTEQEYYLRPIQDGRSGWNEGLGLKKWSTEIIWPTRRVLWGSYWARPSFVRQLSCLHLGLRTIGIYVAGCWPFSKREQVPELFCTSRTLLITKSPVLLVLLWRIEMMWWQMYLNMFN